ncbi:TrkH family potassium uptake protein [Paenibacillus harenae]|uniref:TrkH family potassium uptake protein n=1 Tax=Paenibacillus harenae TaxID=306543 RepID=UPI0003F6B69C|nr:TrkH family potassium uptake protein [Paenibacillus harenae]
MRNSKSTRLSSPRIIIMGFGLVILIGTILLALPLASEAGESIGILDAFFTSASAVCVTGLIVVDTPSAFTTFGEIVIMFLIQVGGLGFMTFGVIIAILLGKRIGLKERLLIQQSTNTSSAQGVVRLSLNIFLISVVIEAISALILTFRWMGEYGFMRALYYGVFHSISAFNNAGFALWSDSLMQYVGDPVVNLLIAFLFITGGIGFTVILDVSRKRSWKDLSLHTKLVLSVTAVLIVVGTIMIFALEYNNPATLGDLSTTDKLWASFFQGVVPRTAGFNTLDITSMMAPSLFFIIFLMFIGASSGSTGGGIKTNTFAVLVLSVFSTIRGQSDTQIYQRRIELQFVMRSLSVIIISLGVVLVSAFLLTITERNSMENLDFLTILFEATSAFGTVGLSMGLTYELSPLGKIIIIFTMFIGRLGPLTLAFALAQASYKQSYRYAEEKILIG